MCDQAYKGVLGDVERLVADLDEEHGAVGPAKERLSKAVADFHRVS